MGKWWLVTWNTYASWLPGDPCGFQTWRKRRYIPPPSGTSDFDEPVYNPDKYKAEHARSKQISNEMVRLSKKQCQHVLEEVVSDIETMTLFPSILAVASTHIHLIAKFGEHKIRQVVGRLKFTGTQRLKSTGFYLEKEQLWSKGCHMKSLPDELAYETAVEYVCKHAESGAIVHTWKEPF